MRVTVISDTAQEFRGVRYYRCGSYFQRHGQRLHRVVWAHFNGRIPRGAHIHHHDGNVENNQPDNLVCVVAAEHLAHHGKLRAGQAAADLAEHARPSAMEWHASAEGRAWHKAHWRDNCREAMFRKEQRTCAHCGQTFEGLIRRQFCSNACKSAKRRADKKDHIERHCVRCGKSFWTNGFKSGRFCTLMCSQPGTYQRKRRVA